MNTNGRDELDDFDQAMARLVDELIHSAKTIRYLSVMLGKTIGERDRARATAVTLEQELAMIKRDGDD